MTLALRPARAAYAAPIDTLLRQAFADDAEGVLVAAPRAEGAVR